MDLEAILNRKINSLFPDTNLKAEIIQTLNKYGVEKYEQEPIRLRLAILKLAGNDFEQVKIITQYAKEDFRDVLVWAENPRRCGNGKFFLPGSPENQNLIAADRTEYKEWLEK